MSILTALRTRSGECQKRRRLSSRPTGRVSLRFDRCLCSRRSRLNRSPVVAGSLVEGRVKKCQNDRAESHQGDEQEERSRADGTFAPTVHSRSGLYTQYRRTRTGIDQFPLIPMLHVQCSPICDTYRMYGCPLCPRFGYALAEDQIYLLHRDPHSCTAHRRSSLYLQQTTNKYQQSQIDQGCSPKKEVGGRLKQDL